MDSVRLGQLGGLLRHERETRALTQRALAERAGTTQATVARVERGDRVPSLDLLDRLFTALGVQLTVSVEPLDAHLDAVLDELAARPLADRVAGLGVDRVLDRLGDLPYVLAGGTAALLQGAPIPVDSLDLAIRWRDSARFTAWLEQAYGQRWDARWKQFGGVPLAPEEPGDHHWQTRYG
ncbi:XRE family transcriptional regulator, partial [Micromonospora fluostatini]